MRPVATRLTCPALPTSALTATVLSVRLMSVAEVISTVPASLIVEVVRTALPSRSTSGSCTVIDTLPAMPAPVADASIVEALSSVSVFAFTATLPPTPLLADVAAIEPPLIRRSVSDATCTRPPGPPEPVAVLPEKIPLLRAPTPLMRRSLIFTSMLPPTPGPDVSAEMRPPAKRLPKAPMTVTLPPRPGPLVFAAIVPKPLTLSTGTSTRTLPPAPVAVVEAHSAAMPVNGASSSV